MRYQDLHTTKNMMLADPIAFCSTPGQHAKVSFVTRQNFYLCCQTTDGVMRRGCFIRIRRILDCCLRASMRLLTASDWPDKVMTVGGSCSSRSCCIPEVGTSSWSLLTNQPISCSNFSHFHFPENAHFIFPIVETLFCSFTTFPRGWSKTMLVVTLFGPGRKLMSPLIGLCCSLIVSKFSKK